MARGGGGKGSGFGALDSEERKRVAAFGGSTPGKVRKPKARRQTTAEVRADAVRRAMQHFVKGKES